MAAVGGSIESVSIDGREFAVAADADVGRKFGGMENEVELNGNGTQRVKQTRVGWSLSDITLSLDDDAGDQEFLQDIADSARTVACAITYASGAIYSGDGTITGEISGASMNTTGGVTLSGGGKLTKQA